MSLLPIVARQRTPEAVGLPTRQTFDQKAVNCCLSCAIASAMEATDISTPPLAPLFHFHFAGGQNSLSAGLTVSQAQGTLLRKGICAFTAHPFSISPQDVARDPSEEAVSDGFKRRLIDAESGALRWKPVPDIHPEKVWKRYLIAGFPIVIALQPNQEYLGLNADNAVLSNNGGPYSNVGHAAVVIGYSDADDSFIVQDSRAGTAFGIEGQWFLPYKLCTSPFLMMAFSLAPDDFN